MTRFIFGPFMVGLSIYCVLGCVWTVFDFTRKGRFGQAVFYLLVGIFIAWIMTIHATNLGYL